MARLRLTRQNLRLGTGLILFAYVAVHLANHALGLISIGVAERGLRIAVAVWHSLPVTILLYGAAGIHIALAFAALYERRTLRMPPLEGLRIVLGLGTPLLLIAHVVATRVAFELYDAPGEYSRIVWNLWNSNREGRQMALLVPGWLHGCLGLNFAFGRRLLYQRLRLYLFGAALLLPVLAVLGFLAMVKEVSLLALDPAWINANVMRLTKGQSIDMARVSDGLLALYLAAIGAVLLARIIRRAVESGSDSLVTITYPGRSVRVPRGWTVLEASRSHHIPHLSMCGGRARCSTCRVRVIAGAEQCPPPAPNELVTLSRIHAPENTRLACQLRPDGDVTVIPLLMAAPSSPRPLAIAAVERDIAVMLVSFRGAAAPRRMLPQDLLYLLNRYSETVGEVVRMEGGIPTHFSGDRVTVIFGLDVGPKEANRQALKAAALVDQRLHALRDRLAQELGCTVDYFIHLHTGRAGVGETGDHALRTLTAVGDTIEVAQQLAAAHSGEGMGSIVLSQAVALAAGLNVDPARWRELVLQNGVRLRVASVDDPAAAV